MDEPLNVRRADLTRLTFADQHALPRCAQKKKKLLRDV